MNIRLQKGMMVQMRTDLIEGKKATRGFSIAEVAIAMAVVTLLLTTFLGLFGPAQKNIQRALSSKDANRLKDALVNELSILRPTEVGDDPENGEFSSAFEKAFYMISNSHDENKAVLIYQYRAELEDDNNDGILPVYLGADGIQGKDYIIQTAVRDRDVNESIVEDELEAVDGAVYVVRMTQIVYETPTGGEARLTVWKDRDDFNAGITDPNSPSSAVDFEDFTEAVISFRAQFFRLSVNKGGFVLDGSWDFDSIGNTVAEANMAISR